MITNPQAIIYPEDAVPILAINGMKLILNVTSVKYFITTIYLTHFYFTHFYKHDIVQGVS